MKPRALMYDVYLFGWLPFFAMLCYSTIVRHP